MLQLSVPFHMWQCDVMLALAISKWWFGLCVTWGSTGTCVWKNV